MKLLGTLRTLVLYCWTAAMNFGYKTKPSFTVANEAQISAPPAVSFEKPASR